MVAFSPVFKIFYRVSIVLIASFAFCGTVFSAEDEPLSTTPVENAELAPQILEEAKPVEAVESNTEAVLVVESQQETIQEEIIQEQTTPEQTTSEEITSSPTTQDKTTTEKQKNIGDHFRSLNPFKGNKNKEETQTASNSFNNSQNDLTTEINSALLVDKEHKVEDLAYGEILLDYYTNNNFDALIKARVAQDQSKLNRNSLHTELLLTQLYILEGLPNEAEASLKKIANGRVSDQTRNRALFQLVRIHLYQGDLESAKRILEQEIGSLSESLELEKISLLSNIYTAQNNKEAVNKLLSSAKPESSRNGYIKYNLASAGIFAGNEEFALPLFLELSSSDHVDLESRSLKDQVNLNLGMHYLKQEKIEEAKTYFNLVSYEGPHSSAALYYLAWIALNQNETKTAFALWVDLSKRNPTDPYVGKSYLIRPYTLEKLNSSHLALSGYLRASELYDKLIDDVDSTIKIIESDVWFEKLGPASLDSTSIYEKVAKQPSWIQTQTNEANFLIELYSSDEFSIIRQNFWELELLRRDVENQNKKFQIFQLQHDTHNEKFDRLIPEARVVLASDRMQRILDRIEVVQQDIKSITIDNNYLGAPTESQVKLLEQFNYLQSILDQEPSDQYQSQRRYLAMLQGINAWDMGQDMHDRQWKIRKQYRELSELLAKTKAHREQIRNGINNANYYEEILPKLNTVSAQIELKSQELELLSLKYQKLMQTRALDILNERNKEYKSLRVRAKLAAARLQDSIVTGGKK